MHFIIWFVISLNIYKLIFINYINIYILYMFIFWLLITTCFSFIYCLFWIISFLFFVYNNQIKWNKPKNEHWRRTFNFFIRIFQRMLKMCFFNLTTVFEFYKVVIEFLVLLYCDSIPFNYSLYSAFKLFSWWVPFII